MEINDAPPHITAAAETAVRCHEIQTSLGLLEVPEFDQLRKVGMAVKVALHIQGLPVVNYETLKQVAAYYMDIPAVAMSSVIDLLAEVEFVRVQSEGKSIKAVVPTVPYYETLYQGMGELAATLGFNEAEQLSVVLLNRLSKAPEKVDLLVNELGAETKLIQRSLDLGKRGSYLRIHRSRGRDIALSPAYFSENADLFADAVAGGSAPQVAKVMSALRRAQGLPLSIVEERGEVAGIKLTTAEVALLKHLAQDGAVRPPSISTQHAGQQFFLFTPTPGRASLLPTKRDIYERAMALVAAVRQGEFLPKQYAIRSPGAVLNRLKQDLKLGKATTEARHQYAKLVHLRVAQLVDVGSGFSELHIIDTRENREALSIAYDLVDAGVAAGTDVDDDARAALQHEQSYVESIIASKDLLKREKIDLTQEQQLELEGLFYG
ncbi:MAG: hypothetical protein KIS66_16625 [Fimbriimonadaceae bacterium]|nr:hypothetical protein [Fimbriimonadaceae bacterium]